MSVPRLLDAGEAAHVVELARRAGLSPEVVVPLQAGATYRVYMYGFAPGFANLGGLPNGLSSPRRASPRPLHPRNALVAGGGLAAIATVPMPTGWYVAGATPSRLYAPERAESFFVAAGDAIRFELVDAATLDALAARGSEGRRCMNALIVEAVGPAITLQDGGRHCTLR